MHRRLILLFVLVVLAYFAFSFQKADASTQIICQGIALHETNMCTSGTGKSMNNCVGIRRNGKFVSYTTVIEGMSDCINVWDRLYGGNPTLQKALRWTSNDRAVSWLNTVLWYMKSVE